MTYRCFLAGLWLSICLSASAQDGKVRLKQIALRAIQSQRARDIAYWTANDDRFRPSDTVQVEKVYLPSMRTTVLTVLYIYGHVRNVVFSRLLMMDLKGNIYWMMPAAADEAEGAYNKFKVINLSPTATAMAITSCDDGHYSDEDFEIASVGSKPVTLFTFSDDRPTWEMDDIYFMDYDGDGLMDMFVYRQWLGTDMDAPLVKGTEAYRGSEGGTKFIPLDSSETNRFERILLRRGKASVPHITKEGGTPIWARLP